ncbi:MAG: (Fe-S)-binding protein [Thermodesulfobacteriota bacterium]|nr:(Fe-S)-binding protein [Thermodesulfobacteriota bacterium]
MKGGRGKDHPKPGTRNQEPETKRPELSCAKCGSCSVVCPVFRVDGRESMTARGKMHLLATGLVDHPSAVFENLFSQCLLCGACEQVCPRNLPITDIISKARSRFSTFYGRGGLQKVVARSLLARPGLLEGLVRAGISLKRINGLPAHSGLRLKLGLLETRSQKKGTDLFFCSNRGLSRSQKHKKINLSPFSVSYFTGCLARHLQPSVAKATTELLASCGQSAHVPVDQNCCGLAAWSAGRRDQARSLARNNIEAFESLSGPILTSCASCSSHLFTYPDLFVKDDPWRRRAQQFADRVQEFTAFFGKSLPEPQPDTGSSLQIFYHDPCHLRFTANGQAIPRALLTRMGLQIVEPENGPSCCGQGGLFHLAYPETSAKIFNKISRRVLACQPDCITTTCSGCLMQYQYQQEDTRVVHLAVLLNELFVGENHLNQALE